jgi:hypothetical protein
VGDCFFIASAAALAEYPDRIKSMFKTQTLNNEGILALQVYIKGKPEIITIDTSLPLKSQQQLMFSR